MEFFPEEEQKLFWFPFSHRRLFQWALTTLKVAEAARNPATATQTEGSPPLPCSSIQRQKIKGPDRRKLSFWKFASRIPSRKTHTSRASGSKKMCSRHLCAPLPTPRIPRAADASQTTLQPPD